MSQLTVAQLDLLDRSNADLQAFQDEKLQGAILRCKAMWYNNSQKRTKYFYSLEKAKSGAKDM